MDKLIELDIVMATQIWWQFLPPTVILI